MLDAADFYVYDYADYYTYSVRFDGEQQITAALYRLTSGEPSQAYYTTGHGEKTLSSTLLDALEAQNIEAEPLSLLSGPVPEDCALLIIDCPASDFAGAEGAVDETAFLQDYLDGGGKVLVLTDAYYSTPNLDAVLAGFGLSRVEGLVVEGDANHSLYGYSYYLLPDYAAPTESTALDGLDTSAPVLLQMAQGIAITPADGVTAEPLLTTTAAAYSKTAGYNMTTTDKEEGDLDGPFDLAVWAEADGTGAQVIWVGCSNMDDDLTVERCVRQLRFSGGVRGLVDRAVQRYPDRVEDPGSRPAGHPGEDGGCGGPGLSGPGAGGAAHRRGGGDDPPPQKIRRETPCAQNGAPCWCCWA